MTGAFKFVLGARPSPRCRSTAPWPGQPARRGEAPRAKALAASAIASWPYTVYYGSLHGQTNDSDGGGDLATCNSSQAAQSGKFGPMRPSLRQGQGPGLLRQHRPQPLLRRQLGPGQHLGRDAKARYTAGVTIATNYTASNPGFLAMYGMEWGVISGGGHLNIFNSDELYSWEYDPSNQLYGHRFIAKNDYATLYR
jgi:hypothetical protein